MESDFSNSKILIVDDVRSNIDVLAMALREDCRVEKATGGQAALDSVDKSKPDLILLDIMMPEIDGYEVCSRLKADEATQSIPIIFITALNEIGDKAKAFELGAVDYITKPFHIAEVRARVRTHLTLKKAMQALSNQNRMLDALVRARTSAVKETQLEIIYRLSRAAEYRDNETGQHILRISHFCRSIAAEMDCDEETCELIFHASPMHDIGKIGIPDHILLKSGSLTQDEWTVMQNHTVMGAKILSGHKALLLQMGQLIALTHHEKWDGSGYPQGLAEYEIPFGGRIVAICDVFDALTSKRVYKKAWPLDDALRVIREGSGAAFDPIVVEAFFRSLPELLHIKESFGDPAPDEDSADAQSREEIS